MSAVLPGNRSRSETGVGNKKSSSSQYLFSSECGLINYLSGLIRVRKEWENLHSCNKTSFDS